MKVTSAALFIAIALVVFGISYYYITTRHRERMALLEKGLPKDHFKGNAHYLPLVLTLGILCVSIGLGTLLGRALDNLGLWDLGHLVYVVAIFLSMGCGLLLSHALLKRIRDKE